MCIRDSGRAAQQLGKAPDRGDGGLELMAGVGEELLPHLDRIFADGDVREHGNGRLGRRLLPLPTRHRADDRFHQGAAGQRHLHPRRLRALYRPVHGVDKGDVAGGVDDVFARHRLVAAQKAAGLSLIHI